ncbi:hypothetical protein Ancab_021343 [Ancistrocladus abbreviatus]
MVSENNLYWDSKIWCCITSARVLDLAVGMPASPSLRRSLQRESCADSHKRGRSLENVLSFKEKDDNLALFSEMDSRERENFLLQPTDDFEDIFSGKLKSFPGFKLGITIPVRGESSDPLNEDADKNDYDWLLTPPESPLFPSLDDEPAPVNLLHSGRIRSRPISISRSSTMEKSYNSRGSASPQRLSLSPRSRNGTFTSQGRPSSAPYSSPTPSSWHSTPSRRLSPPPAKPSTPPQRSATPTSRRCSTGSGGTLISSGVRGASPVRTSRGNSASPKVRAWQSNIPGFSLEAPSNLHTSLADHPASYVRGSSPAPRSSRGSPSKIGRQSMSPTASRSISLSHSHERDRLGSHSKGSIASSGEDDADSFQSIPISSSEGSVPRRVVSGFLSNRPLAYSKKATKTLSQTTTSKRSFDSTMRQMDRTSPQNMFRPLLSGVPSTTFYSSKAGSYRSMISRNSSLTASSNASSDQATSGAPETEGSDHNQDDMTSECRRGLSADIQDEVFAFDKMEAASGGTGREIQEGLPHIQVGEHEDSEIESGLDDFGELRHHDTAVATDTSSEGLYAQADSMEVGSSENKLLCSRCGCRYPVSGPVESEVNICPQCKLKELSTASTIVIKMDVAQNSSDPLVRNSECGSLEAAEPVMSVLGLPDTVHIDGSRSILLTALPKGNVTANQSSYGESRQSCFFDDSPPASAGEESMHMHSEQQAGIHLNSHGPSNSAYQGQELYKFGDSSLPKVDVTGGAGISVLLLKRSNSSKGPLMQSQNITVSAISYEDLCYARDTTTSMRSSTGHGSVSTSSSIDLTSGKLGETCMERQLSSTRSDMISKPQSYQPFFSGASTHAYQSLGITTNTGDEKVEASIGNMGHIVRETPQPLLAFENSKFLNAVTSIARTTLSEEDNCHSNISSKSKDADSLELFSNTSSTQSEDNSLASFAVDEDHVFQRIVEQCPKSVVTVAKMEESAGIAESSFVEGSAVLDKVVDQLEFTEILDHKSFGAMSEVEIDDCDPGSPASQIETAPKGNLQEVSAMRNQDKEVLDSVPPFNGSDHMRGVLVESTVMVEDQGGWMTRSLTLEEATDAILFCGSIVQNLVYEAASIAIEKEKENLVPLEVSRPLVTILGKLNPKDLRGRTPRKCTEKSPRPKQRRVELGVEPPSSKTEIDDEPIESTVRIVGLPNKVDGMKPLKLESKCNCTIM